ncbi:MAG: thymidylate synthase [Candidatus Woesearchaeota archaeon]
MKTAIKKWAQALTKIRKQGYKYVDTNNRVCVEMMNLKIVLEDPKNMQIEKPIEFISKNDKWLYPSKTEISNIMFKEVNSPSYDYTYGGRIFNFSKKLDQVQDYIIPLLKKDKASRRAVINIYDPIKDSKLDKRNAPSIMYLAFRIINSKLCITACIRSSDMFFGWPANIYQIYSIQSFIANELNLNMGSLTTISNTAHIFESDFEYVEDLINENT